MVCILSYIPNGRTVKRNILDIGLPPSCDPVKVWEVKVAAVKAPKALQGEGFHSSGSYLSTLLAPSCFEEVVGERISSTRSVYTLRHLAREGTTERKLWCATHRCVVRPSEHLELR